MATKADVGKVIADCLIHGIEEYERQRFAKVVGVGLPQNLANLSPALCSRIWLDIDAVPIVSPSEERCDICPVNDLADTMARRCVMSFGPSLTPLLQVGSRGLVMGDAEFRAQLLSLSDYRKTCGDATWKSAMYFVSQLQRDSTKIAFFSATPQGGGVALMRHALVRFARTVGVDISWYVPRPRPGVFRSTKNMHNILQGVSHETQQRLTEAEKCEIHNWINDNAKEFWLSEGGPLRAPSDGGADIIVIDDPQMPGLIPLAKAMAPDRPVIFRSHIQIRSDLVAAEGSPQQDVWKFLWNDIRRANLFVSQPVPEFVPTNVPLHSVAYMPATTDWLDGLNKPLNQWALDYYGRNYNVECRANGMSPVNFEEGNYILQIARFDPAKGISVAVNSYATFRRQTKDVSTSRSPQLVIAGNSSVDDPDSNDLFNQVLHQIETECPEFRNDISVMRLESNDQLLNTLVSRARVVLQLSTAEGFEVKVSEALHAGRPVIATRAGGISMQVRHGVDGFLVEPGDYQTVARHLNELYYSGDESGLWRRMSEAARNGVSDEVGTVGNALCWLYLAAELTSSETANARCGAGKWVNDLAREAAGVPYQQGEIRLSRQSTAA